MSWRQLLKWSPVMHSAIQWLHKCRKGPLPKQCWASYMLKIFSLLSTALEHRNVCLPSPCMMFFLPCIAKTGKHSILLILVMILLHLIAGGGHVLWPHSVWCTLQRRWYSKEGSRLVETLGAIHGHRWVTLCSHPLGASYSMLLTLHVQQLPLLHVHDSCYWSIIQQHSKNLNEEPSSLV